MIKDFKDYHLLWDYVSHQWANEDSVEGLHNWLDENLCTNNLKYLKSAMAQRTPFLALSYMSEEGMM